MRIKQKRSVIKPVEIGSRFVTKIVKLLTEAQASNIKFILEKFDVTFEQITSVDERPWEETRKVNSARIELSSKSETKASCVYDDGRSFEIVDIDSLTGILDDQTGSLKELTLSTGSGDGLTVIYFSVDSSRSYGLITYSIEGEQSLVNHFKSEFDDAIAETYPDYQILHSAAPGFIISASLIVLGMFGLWAFINEAQAHQFKVNPVFFTGVFCLVSLLGIVVNQQIVGFYYSAFPKCSFDFGKMSDRRLSKKRAIFALFSVVLLPIVLAVFGL